jgi:hypothetical protein
MKPYETPGKSGFPKKRRQPEVLANNGRFVMPFGGNLPVIEKKATWQQ